MTVREVPLFTTHIDSEGRYWWRTQRGGRMVWFKWFRKKALVAGGEWRRQKRGPE